MLLQGELRSPAETAIAGLGQAVTTARKLAGAATVITHMRPSCLVALALVATCGLAVPAAPASELGPAGSSCANPRVVRDFGKRLQVPRSGRIRRRVAIDRREMRVFEAGTRDAYRVDWRAKRGWRVCWASGRDHDEVYDPFENGTPWRSYTSRSHRWAGSREIKVFRIAVARTKHIGDSCSTPHVVTVNDDTGGPAGDTDTVTITRSPSSGDRVMWRWEPEPGFVVCRFAHHYGGTGDHVFVDDRPEGGSYEASYDRHSWLDEAVVMTRRR